MASRYFSGSTLEQALLSAARALQLAPEEIAYTVRDKKHGFLKTRRRVMIQVDPQAPRRQPDSAEEQPAAEAPVQEPSSGLDSAPHQEGTVDQDAAPAQASSTTDEVSPEPMPAVMEEPPEDRGDEPQADTRPLPEGPQQMPADIEEATPVMDADPTSDADPAEEAALEAELEPASEPKKRSRGRKPAPAPETPESRKQVEDAIDESLETLADFMYLDVDWKIQREPDGVWRVEIEGPDREYLLREEGRALLAVEHVVPRMVRHTAGQGIVCIADCDGFRRDREKRLERIANEAAEDALHFQRPQRLDSMNPADRRIIHLALAEDTRVRTESEGRGYFKRVRVVPEEIAEG